MSPKSSSEKTLQHGAQASENIPSAGPDGVSLTPPAYGMDVLDQPDGFPTIQAKASTPTGDDTPTARPLNRTGLPDALKAGVESLSDVSLDNVRVHYNSPKPVQLNALAYAQGTEIHIAPGQERHLPHEAWHVVQQAQGRVQPTMQMKGGVSINDNQGLEHEADLMGAKASAMDHPAVPAHLSPTAHLPSQPTYQRVLAPKGTFNGGRGWKIIFVESDNGKHYFKLNASTRLLWKLIEVDFSDEKKEYTFKPGNAGPVFKADLEVKRPSYPLYDGKVITDDEIAAGFFRPVPKRTNGDIELVASIGEEGKREGVTVHIHFLGPSGDRPSGGGMKIGDGAVSLDNASSALVARISEHRDFAQFVPRPRAAAKAAAHPPAAAAAAATAASAAATATSTASATSTAATTPPATTATDNAT